MARKPKQKPQPEAAKSFEDPGVFDSEGGDDDASTVEADAPQLLPAAKLRDWRDVEKLKEMRRLRKLVDDDLDFDDKPLR
ncbi:MAG: hypothetical protein ACT4QA_13820 [Panacagrimonas sp.]